MSKSSSFLALPFLFPSLSPTSFFPLPYLLQSSPLISARGLGCAVSAPIRSEQSLAARQFLCILRVLF